MTDDTLEPRPSSDSSADASSASGAGGLSPLKKLLFMGIVLLLFVLGIEGGARLFLEDPADSPLMIPVGPDEWKASELHRSDPYLFWRNRTDVDIVYKGARVVTNSHGMRDDPVTKRKPAGGFRVLSLGESTTFGSKVEQEECYSMRLEECLDGRSAGREVEVLNAGTPGWSLVQSFVYLEREGLEFDPDVILVYHGFNDLLPTSYTSKRVERAGGSGESGPEAGTDLALASRKRGTLERVGAWVHERSRAFRWMAHKAGQAAAEAKRKKPKTTVEEANPKGEQLARVPEADRLEVLTRMERLAKEHGARLLILNPCYRSFMEHRAVLETFVAEHDVEYLDLEPAVESLGGDRKTHFADGSHPKATVHAKYAEMICEKIAPWIEAGS